jgi:hypothetical protein
MWIPRLAMGSSRFFYDRLAVRLGVRSRNFARICVPLAVLSIAACGPSHDPRTGEAAVRSAIFRHLGQRANLTTQNLVVTVNKLDTQGDSAVANVTIAARENQDASMDVVYHLNRVEGRWEVDPESSPGMGAGHGGMGGGGQMPGGHPPVNPGGEPGGSSGGASGGAGSKLPEGHPPVPAQ